MLVVNQKPPSAPRGHLQFLATWLSKVWQLASKLPREKDWVCWQNGGLTHCKIIMGETSITGVIFSWLEARHRSYSHFKGRGSNRGKSIEVGVIGSYFKVFPPWLWRDFLIIAKPVASQASGSQHRLLGSPRCLKDVQKNLQPKIKANVYVN